MMKRQLAASCAAVLTVTLLAGCAGGTGSDGATGEQEFAVDAHLNTLLGTDTSNWHPLISSLSRFLSAYTSDYLFWIEPSGELQPWIATEWAEEPDTLTFTVRNGVTCSDGTDFTAETVVRNLDFVLDPANGSEWLGTYVPADATVTAEGDTVTMKTQAPHGFLAFNLAQVPLVCDAAIDDPEAYYTKSNGTGMFVLTDYQPGDSLTLERRDDYAWAPDGSTGETAGVPKSVTINLVTDRSTQANLLLSGDLNAGAVQGPDEARLLAAGLDFKESVDAPEAIYFNHAEGVPTADPSVRKALIQTLNLDDLTTVMLEGEGTRVTTNLTVSPTPCVLDSTGNLPEFDTKAAAATLEEGGWTPGTDGILEKDGQRLQLDLFYINSTDAMSAAAEIVAEEWKKLGAEVTLSGGDNSWMVGEIWTGENLTGWSATLGLRVSYVSPTPMLQLFDAASPPNGINFSSIANDDFSQNAADASVIAGNESCATWEEAEAALINDVDFVPIATRPSRLFLNGATQTVDFYKIYGFALRALE